MLMYVVKLFCLTGYVYVKLMKPGGEGHDWYRYNKVTTCVHNVFGGQRWVDQYGELKITSGNITCKLTFVKVGFLLNHPIKWY